MGYGFGSQAVEAKPSRIRVDTPARRARHDTVVPVAIRCAWCEGWMSLPVAASNAVSHGLCDGCREHVREAAAQG